MYALFRLRYFSKKLKLLKWHIRCGLFILFESIERLNWRHLFTFLNPISHFVFFSMLILKWWQGYQGHLQYSFFLSTVHARSLVGSDVVSLAFLARCKDGCHGLSLSPPRHEGGKFCLEILDIL
jgi:hypothetical protein